MKSLVISNEDFEILRECRLKDRSDWCAVFSAEPHYGSIYPFTTRGLTPLHHRQDLRREFPKLAEIADIYLDFRPEGGRFFVNSKGAFFHEKLNGPYDQFLKFIIQPVAVTAYKTST